MLHKHSRLSDSLYFILRQTDGEVALALAHKQVRVAATGRQERMLKVLWR